MKTLTEFLELQKLNIIDAMQLIKSTKESINEINEDNRLDDLIGSAEAFVKICRANAETGYIKHHLVRKISKRIKNCPETAANSFP